MEIYELRTLDAEHQWSLLCTDDEMVQIKAALRLALATMPHTEHDCDEDAHACDVFYMLHNAFAEVSDDTPDALRSAHVPRLLN